MNYDSNEPLSGPLCGDWQDELLLSKTISEVLGKPFRIYRDLEGTDLSKLQQELLAVGSKTNLEIIKSERYGSNKDRMLAEKVWWNNFLWLNIERKADIRLRLDSRRTHHAA